MMARILGLLNNLVNDDYLLGDGEKRRRANLTFSAVFMIFVSFLLLLIGLLRKEYLDAAVAGATICFNLFTLFLLYRVRNYEWAQYIFAMGMLAVAWVRLLFGASQLYSALWVLAYPMLFCLFFGNAFARPYLTLLLASMIVILSPLFASWRTSEYPADLQMQLPLMFVAFSLLGMFAEYIRSRTSQRLLHMFKHYFETANRDQLTGLLNRRAFHDVIHRELARVRRHHIGLQLVMCDVDFFKSINDRFGHHGGDQYLRHIASLLLQQLRAEDYCFRWGGEEFLLLLPNTTPPQALLVARRLLEAIRDAPLADSEMGEIATTMSFGVHAFVTSLTIEENIALADERLYEAKESGRDRVVQTAYE
ncbi:MAG: GGDEF domain-containing protein [Oscillospiraceae bacterium]|nr:GGDEF domain-containing protein [Oscillospiraceae bacterium]